MSLVPMSMGTNYCPVRVSAQILIGSSRTRITANRRSEVSTTCVSRWVQDAEGVPSIAGGNAPGNAVKIFPTLTGSHRQGTMQLTPKSGLPGSCQGAVSKPNPGRTTIVCQCRQPWVGARLVAPGPCTEGRTKDSAN